MPRLKRKRYRPFVLENEINTKTKKNFLALVFSTSCRYKNVCFFTGGGPDFAAKKGKRV